MFWLGSASSRCEYILMLRRCKNDICADLLHCFPNHVVKTQYTASRTMRLVCETVWSKNLYFDTIMLQSASDFMPNMCEIFPPISFLWPMYAYWLCTSYISPKIVEIYWLYQICWHLAILLTKESRLSELSRLPLCLCIQIDRLNFDLEYTTFKFGPLLSIDHFQWMHSPGLLFLLVSSYKHVFLFWLIYGICFWIMLPIFTENTIYLIFQTGYCRRGPW